MVPLYIALALSGVAPNFVCAHPTLSLSAWQTACICPLQARLAATTSRALHSNENLPACRHSMLRPELRKTGHLG